jgi:hypothetical protein
MSRVIYKYEVNNGPIQMPKGAEILTVQMQHGKPMLWALVDIDHSNESRAIVIIGTGHDFDFPDYKYIATFQDGAYVWHVFEIPNL